MLVVQSLVMVIYRNGLCRYIDLSAYLLHQFSVYSEKKIM